MAQPRLLAHLTRERLDLERRRVGVGEQGRLGDANLELPGWQLAVDGLRRAPDDLAGRGLKGQMRHADRLGVANAVILDEGEAMQLRDMRSGEQHEIDVADVVEELSAR